MGEEHIELSPSSPAQASQQPQESLYNFISRTPPPVTRLIVELQPVIAYARWMAQVTSWKSGSPSESWLVLGCWWLICLSLKFGLRYLLPFLVALPFAIKWASGRFPLLKNLRFGASTRPPAAPTDEHAINATLADVAVLHSLLPQIPAIPQLQSAPVALRLAGGLTTAYFIVLLLVPFYLIVAIIGTLGLTWRSPWVQSSRRILRRSGWVRWGSRRLWMLLSGIERKPSANTIDSALYQHESRSKFRVQGDNEESANGSSTATPDVPGGVVLRFKFTILENQRWWMGLDWTAALLPNERPSWCTEPPSLHAIPPPSALSLPGPSTVYLPLPSNASNAKAAGGFRMKRTAKWRWEDNEWGVLVVTHTGGKDGPTTVERVPIDASKLDTTDTSASSAAKLVDAVGKSLRRGTGDFHSLHSSPPKEPSALRDSSSSPTGRAHSPGTKQHNHHVAHHDDYSTTDADGWVYADNKWEGDSPKAGIGKYTRYRRWTRVAVLEEKVEVIPSSTEEPVTSPSTSIDAKPSNNADSHPDIVLRQRSVPKNQNGNSSKS